MAQDVWRKVLYEKQGVPDNFVNRSFLRELRKNVNVTHFTLKQALYAATFVVQQISRAVLFVVLFENLHSGFVSPWTLFCSIAGLVLLGYLLSVLGQCGLPTHVFRDILKCGVFTLCLAPVMRTLTETISTDTIRFLVLIMLFLHLLCHDYCQEDVESQSAGNKADFGEEPPVDVWSTVSLSAALSASVCLASRLEGFLHVAALSTLAVVTFLLVPIFASWLQVMNLHIMATFAQVALSLVMLAQISPVSAVLFASLLVCVGVLLPAHFVHCQKYKNSARKFASLEKILGQLLCSSCCFSLPIHRRNDFTKVLYGTSFLPRFYCSHYMSGAYIVNTFTPSLILLPRGQRKMRSCNVSWVLNAISYDGRATHRV
ncbi:phosphatidylinositol N-acetylglucosaminyltransferase subunit C-like isoform X2 [Ornithodoros turicata]|uniref:phosphatidylinositol N-acetylglucosaminyltransferase subunit C-like isoform X2 n=1 Tax=Ornithodoros turicata TaxID=34597 RepID=UPI003139834B